MTGVVSGHDGKRGGRSPRQASAIAEIPACPLPTMWLCRFSGLRTESLPDRRKKCRVRQPRSGVRSWCREILLNAGALAFRRTGNPNNGDFEEPSWNRLVMFPIRWTKPDGVALRLRNGFPNEVTSCVYQKPYPRW